ncbi:MAG: carboxypeptidase regulatory-like domain-containing protein [Bryobacterales bacterium]|nr:carboxypeptidase regulatory-like domain-containing protein [Bryobacterales bacterium]MBV9401982.1 carboxypeptidase regulatory-like domain-containing protein [Bryobacterales bacterium]
MLRWSQPLLALVAFGYLYPLSAQSASVLSGKVLDPSGAFIPKAAITLKGPGDQVKAVESDDAGVFRVVGLTAGEYTLRSTAPGFALFETPVKLTGTGITNLDIHMTIALERQEVTVADQAQVEVDPAANSSAVTVQGEELKMFSDDPCDLQNELLALAGPSVGPNGGQIFVDGFSNGQLPPKDSIREIRINTNPFSAEFDRVGMGRIEILTKPGTDQFHGSGQFNFSDSALNSRNPYATEKPPSQTRQGYASVSGPIGKKASFGVDSSYGTQDQTALVNAQVLNSSFQPVYVSENVDVPNLNAYVSPRIDYALTPNITLQGRYYWYHSRNSNSGVGQFTLPSRGTEVNLTVNYAQLVETQVIGANLINENRFAFNHNYNSQTGDAGTPGINVLSSFNGGGAPLSLNYNRNRNYEYQNNTSYKHRAHFVKFGLRVRGNLQDSYSTSNYNGTYTFTSMQSYQITQQGVALGLPIDQIIAQGGGASQYSVTGGTPLTPVSYVDAEPFVHDDWKVRPNFTLSLGLRYETQSNIRDRRDWAPRAGIAWGIGKGQGGGKPPKTVLRLGGGIFYDRINQGLTLQALRQNGITQQNYLITQPLFYPVAPPISALTGDLLPQAIYKVDSEIQAPQTFQYAATLERQLPKNTTMSVSYTNSRGVHQLRSRDINAPLPGTYTGVPGGGVFPYGNSGQLFWYESSAIFEQQQITVNVNARINSRYTLFGFYSYNHAFSNSDGFASFPANSYDASGEWGRAGFDIRHRLQIGGNISLPWRFQLAPNIQGSSAPPLNITTGTDWNGDTIFNDRPAFATVPVNPAIGVIGSPWGVFNIDPVGHPQFGTIIIPRNFAYGYGRFDVSGRLSRTWTFGRGGEPDRNAQAIQAAVAAAGLKIDPGANNGGKTPGRYSLTLGIQARNALNHVNPGPPNTNLSSPFLGQVLQNNGPSNANRRLELSLRFAF